MDDRIENSALSRALREQDDKLKKLKQDSFSPGRYVSFEPTASGTVTRAHGLGRRPQGWIVVDTDVAHPTRDSWDKVNLALTFTGAGTCKVWVY